jgi:8-oxo-dGTP diphosphatase
MAVTNDQGEVRAAGGVVCRPAREGATEVLLAHRPRYDDWTLPKGKAEVGESDEACALREVHEETGLHCRLLDELPTIRYRDRFDRPKVVRYWKMEPISGAFSVSDEVDALAWLPIPAALEQLTYPRDAEVLRGLVGTDKTAG